jgi:phenylacetate-coenzyme A ligase PaaK-like adenylate-forming protein
MPAEIVTTDDLREFKIELIQEIKKILKENHAPQFKKWLKSNDVRDMLDVSSSTLQNLRDKGTLPFTKIGGVMFYNYEDVKKMLANNLMGID